MGILLNTHRITSESVELAAPADPQEASTYPIEAPNDPLEASTNPLEAPTDPLEAHSDPPVAPTDSLVTRGHYWPTIGAYGSSRGPYRSGNRC